MFKARTFLVLLLLPALAAASESDCVDYGVLLDPEAPRENRLQQLAVLERAADGGSSTARYIAGLFYLAGDRHFIPIVAQDPTRAEALLSRAAIDGRIEAMAAMAEAEIAGGESDKAAVWAQLSGHYARTARLSLPPSVGDYASRSLGVSLGYMKSYNRAALAIEYAGGMVEKYDASIQRGIARWPAVDHAVCGAGPTEALTMDPAQVEELHRIRAANFKEKQRRTRSHHIVTGFPKDFMIALVQVDAAGVVRDRLIVHAFGSAEWHPRLLALADELRFNAIDSPDAMRWALVPLSLEDVPLASED
jgi:hypothetical protein